MYTCTWPFDMNVTCQKIRRINREIGSNHYGLFGLKEEPILPLLVFFDIPPFLVFKRLSR